MNFDFELVTRTMSSAGQGGNDGVLKSWSPDGRFFMFSSYSSAVATTDTNGKPDYYVFDTQTGGIILIDHASGSAATTANGEFSYGIEPMFLPNGRIVFYHSATDMAGTDTNGHPDMFIFNPYDGTTKLVSHTLNSQTTTSAGYVSGNYEYFSADGNYLLLTANSDATDMAAHDSNGNTDLYLYDVSTGTYDLVTHAAGDNTTTVTSNGNPGYLFAPDGNHVAYDLASTQSGVSVNTAYVYDRVTHAQVAMTGGNYTTSMGFSPDGRYLIYTATTKTSLGVDPADIRLWDTQTNTSLLVSHVYGNQSIPVHDTVNIGYGNLDVWFTPDSKSLLIESSAGSMAQNDTNGQPDLYLYDVTTGNIDLITHQYGSNAAAGAVNNSLSIEGYSANSRYLIYSTNTATIANSDTNGAWDYFVYDRQTHNNIIVGQASSGTATTGNGNYTSTHANWLSPDSKYLLFFTNSSNIAASDTTNTYDTFLLNLETGTTKLVTHALGAESGTAIGAALDVPDSLQDTRLSPYSSDGRYILLSTNNASAFTSDQDDHSNGSYGDDLFLYDIQTGDLKLITHAYNSPTVTGNGASEDGVFTADGKYVVFTSYASNLINAGSVGSTANVFLYEIATGTTTLISQNSSGLSANNSSYQAHVSPDGSHLALYSGASNLNGSNRTSGSGYDIYITDLPSGGAGPVNAAPTALNFTNTVSSISETSSTASHIKIADIGVTDDGLGTNVLSLSGTDAAFFEIVGGVLYLKAGTVLNHDTKASYNVSVLVDDTSVGSTPDLSKSLTLAVTDSGGSGPANAAPTALTFTNTLASILENSSTASHIKVADIGVTDDGLGTNVLSLSGEGAGYFEIIGNALYLKAGSVLDYETKTSYAVTVSVDDNSVGGTPDASKSLTLMVTDVKGVSLKGTSGKNTIDGTHPIGGKVPGMEADTIKGLGGNDKISGLGGHDKLLGGTGKDALSGGADGDTFVFAKGDSGIKSSNADKITDWSTDDSIDTSIAGKSSNYYEHKVKSSVDTIEEAADYAKAHVTSSKIAHVFLYNTSEDIGFLLMDLNHDHKFETGVVLSHSGQAGDFGYLDLI
jgi:Tol biopolymer transport system component